jgi:carbon monoxide dehydrogenase subunit G
LTKQKHDWLLDAEVQYKVTPVKGRWEVSLLFINTKNPNQVLVQTIGHYRSERLAEIYGRNMQQTAAKDPRGTQKVDKDAYDINNN